MGLKSHMQHNQTAGIVSGKIQSGRKSKMAAVINNNKTNKIIFSPERLKFCMTHYWDPGSRNNQNKKKTAAELGHRDLLSVYESRFAKIPICQEPLNRFSQFQSD